MEQPGVIVVGSGQGGFQVAASLRDEGYIGSVLLIGEEPGLPYQRPPLSKSFLSDKLPAPQIDLRPEIFYSDRGIRVMTGQRVARIVRSTQHIELASGASLPYEHLVLATGARPRMPTIPGAHLAGVLALRTRADANALLASLRRARRLVAIGAGFIGLEVAATACDMGLEVQVLEFADRVLQRAVSVQTAEYLAGALQARGVVFSYATGAIGFSGTDGHVTGVQTTHGDTVPADLVVVGIGVEPNAELALSAGLDVHDGIVVDAHLQSSDPAISAIGDCARYPVDYIDSLVRIESVQNAVDQARCVAARLTGRRAPYRKVPWFWSDQGAIRLQIAGVAHPQDISVLRGQLTENKFSVYRFRGDRLTAVESVNNAADHMGARKLLAHPECITPAHAADPQLPLASLLPGT